MAAGLVLAVLLAAAPPIDSPARPGNLSGGGQGPGDRLLVVPQPPAAPSEVYSGLFRLEGQAPEKPAQPSSPPKALVIESRPQPKTKIVCGTTLIIVGSEADPAMVKPRPESQTRYPIGRMPPPACGQKE